METIRLNTGIPKPLADRIDALAERTDRPAASIIEEALESWANLADEQTRLTREGIADVDEGRLVAHQDVLAWAESLKQQVP